MQIPRTFPYTAKTIRLFGVDGRVLFLLMLAVYNIAWWTFITAVSGIVILMLLERKGYDVPNALRWVRVVLLGPRRPAVIGRRRGRSDR